MPTRRDIVLGYIRLPHVVPILAVLAATTCFAIVAAGGWPGTGKLLALLGAMLGGQVAVGATNELVDVELDARERPDKPIPSGLVSLRGARGLAVAGLGVMALCSLAFPFAAFALCALGNGIGVAYSLWLKRTPWSGLAYSLAIPLIPVWVWTALDTFPARMLALLPLALPAVAALQVAQSLPDVAGDRRAGVQTLAVMLGEDRSLLACWAGVGGSAALAGIAAPWLSDAPLLMWAVGGLASALVAVNAVMVRRDRATGIRRCFPLMALAVIALGVGWTVAVVAV
jgi:geranylgeranylglycerol-phosphate geranylgeranyltransferase